MQAKRKPCVHFGECFFQTSITLRYTNAVISAELYHDFPLCSCATNKTRKLKPLTDAITSSYFLRTHGWVFFFFFSFLCEINSKRVRRVYVVRQANSFKTCLNWCLIHQQLFYWLRIKQRTGPSVEPGEEISSADAYIPSQETICSTSIQWRDFMKE